MADEFDEQDPNDDPEPIWETPGDPEALDLALGPDARPRRTRVILGVVCVVIGLVVAVVAIVAANGGGSDGSDTAGASTSTTAAGAGSEASVAAATTDAGVTKAQWPAGVTGRPKAFGALGDPPPAESGDLPEGFYLWSGFDGWHVWLVGGGEGDRVTITSDDAISKAEPTGGPADVQVFGNTFALQRGSATERVVGADFNPGYYAKNMIITLDGDKRVYVGGGANKVPTYFAIRFQEP